MQKHQRERLQDQFLQQQLLAQAQHRMNKNVRWPGDQLQVNPVILQSKRRREEAEAQAKTPSLSADETVDMEVKRPLIRDTLNMLSTALVDKEQIIRDDRTEHRARLLRNIYNKKAAAQMPGYSSPTREVGGHDVRQACSIGALTQQIAWEESHLGNYRRIMPPRDSEKVNYYCKFYEQNKQPMFADTVASRRREELNHQVGFPKIYHNIFRYISLFGLCNIDVPKGNI